MPKCWIQRSNIVKALTANFEDMKKNRKGGLPG